MALSKTRLKRVEKAVAKPTAKADPMTAYDANQRRLVEEYRDECCVFVARHSGVEEPRMVALLRLMIDPYHEDHFCAWMSGPFARWAMPIPDDYVFPRALIEHLVAHPDDFLGHACERCGLCVPSGGGVPPFPECPACGGRTSSAAVWQKGPVTDQEQRMGDVQTSCICNSRCD
jgi:hypothetical protein